MEGLLLEHRQGQGPLVGPDGDLPVGHVEGLGRGSQQGLKAEGRPRGPAGPLEPFQGLGPFIHHKEDGPPESQTLLQGEPLEDDFQQPLLLHGAQQDLGDIL